MNASRGRIMKRKMRKRQTSRRGGPPPSGFFIPVVIVAFASLFFVPSWLKKNYEKISWDNDPELSEEYFEVPPPPRKDKYPVPKRVALTHIEGWGEGIGYGTDYTSLDVLLAPDYVHGRVMPMIDLRVHQFDNKTYAANVGLAGRYIPRRTATFTEVFGFNVFYDYRQGQKGHYNQVGLGLEVLGERWDFRANGFIPFGKTKIKTKCVYDHYEGGYCAVNRECEFVSYGYNAEVGYLAVNKPNFFFYTAAGPYYLIKTGCGRTGGGKFRVRPQYRDYFAVDFSYSYDNVFHSVFQAEVIVSFPLYQIHSQKRDRRARGLTDRQIYQPIERFEVMPFGRRSCWETNW